MRRHSTSEFVLVVLLSASSCRQAEGTDPVDAAVAPIAPVAVERVRAIRERFPSVGPAVARFEPVAGRIHAVVDEDAKRRVIRSATVDLPSHANAATAVRDDGSGVAITFTMHDVRDVPAQTANGVVLYAGAVSGSDLLQRVNAEGTEDFVVFDQRPEREELSYRVRVADAAGLRLVANALEFLDSGGTPRLRVAPPWIIDADGKRHAATIAVSGCAYDTDASAPWDRPPTKPGADECDVSVRWSVSRYPAIVDPAWTATGSMTNGRNGHTATLLTTGRVLVAGDGFGEVFDGTAAFASAGAMKSYRKHHTATLLSTGSVLITGGEIGGSTTEIYNGTGFVSGPSMTTSRVRHTATLLTSGSVLIVGGQGWPSTGTGLSSAEIYNGSSFSATAPMAVARLDHAAIRLSTGSVLVVGGYNYTTTPDFRTAELFNGSSFAAAGSLTRPRRAPTVVPLSGGRVLIAGGWGWYGSPMTSTPTTAEIYNSGTFTATPNLPALIMQRDAGAVLSSGRVILAQDTSSMAYDGATFTLAGPLVYSRNLHTVTALPSGKVLVTGTDTSGAWAAQSSAELYSGPGGLGSTCTIAAECTSGICDKYCCSVSCAGTCRSCSPTGTSCMTVTSAEDDTCSGNSACSPMGTCLSKNGVSATSGSQCLSGTVADGVCCDSACAGGGCEACNVSGKLGTCTKYAVGNAGSPSCTPYLCNGGSACPTTCTKDADCVGTHFCDAAGTCQPIKAKGGTCDLTKDCKVAGCRECATAFCVDGVCCDKACTGLCEACTTAKSGAGSDGTCTLIGDGRNPDAECPGTTTCVAATLYTQVCNGAGGCRAFTRSCAPYSCDPTGTTCLSSCTSDADCGTDGYCPSSGVCAARKEKGTSCASTNECKVALSCVDGVCCDKACDGQCEACDVAGSLGICTAITGSPHGKRAPCADDGKGCAGTCDGKSAIACAYPDSTNTCGGGCAGSRIALCNGKGGCAEPTPCFDSLTCESPTKCRTTCAADTDCVAGYACTSGKCTPATVKCSADRTMSIDPSGKGAACTPVLCDPKSNLCGLRCQTDADCVAGTNCTSAGECLKPAPTQPDEGSCAIGRRSPTAAAIAAAVVAAIAMRRRRRTSARNA